MSSPGYTTAGSSKAPLATHTAPPGRPLPGVLFLHSAEGFDSYSAVHRMVAGQLASWGVGVHVACSPDSSGRPSGVAGAFATVPGIEVLTYDLGPSLTRGSVGTTLRAVLRRAGPLAQTLFALCWRIRRCGIGIIHTSEKPREVGMGLLLARLTGARLVVHLHVGLDDWVRPLTRYALSRADMLIAVSRFVADMAVDYGGYPSCRLQVALNAVDPDGWSVDTDVSGFRAELGIPADVPLVAIVAKLLPWKGHAILIEALGRAKAAGARFRLAVVGDVVPDLTPGGQAYRETLDALVEKWDLGDSVHFTGWRTDIKRILAASDIFALPSLDEPFGLAYLEAMVMSKPVVALSCGGAREIVDDGITGLLSPPDDPAMLAANLQELLGSADRRQEFGAAGRQRALDLFSPSRLGADVATAYRRALSR